MPEKDYMWTLAFTVKDGSEETEETTIADAATIDDATAALESLAYSLAMRRRLHWKYHDRIGVIDLDDFEGTDKVLNFSIGRVEV